MKSEYDSFREMKLSRYIYISCWHDTQYLAELPIKNKIHNINVLICALSLAYTTTARDVLCFETFFLELATRNLIETNFMKALFQK